MARTPKVITREMVARWLDTAKAAGVEMKDIDAMDLTKLPPKILALVKKQRQAAALEAVNGTKRVIGAVMSRLESSDDPQAAEVLWKSFARLFPTETPAAETPAAS